MNIELDEVVVQTVSDNALELAGGVAQGDFTLTWCWAKHLLTSQVPSPNGVG